MQNVPDEWREGEERMGEMVVKRIVNSEGKKNEGQGGGEGEKESLMMELTKLVQKVVKESSWWERRGIDCSILAAAFLCLAPGKASGMLW